MFDRTYLHLSPVNQHHSHDTKVSVHEHRAPTDESLKLLQEMQKKAFDSVVKVDLLETSIGKIVVYNYIEPENYKECYRAVIKINGETLEATISIYGNEIFDKTDVLIKLRDEIAKSIASKLLMESVEARNIYLRK